MLQSALFAGDSLLQDIADNVGGVRISRHENANSPSVIKVQQALLIRDPGCLPVSGADGVFGGESAAAVHRFKVDELGVEESQVIDDVGPLTVQRLDEIALAAEVTSVAVFNQFGDALADVEVEVNDAGTPRFATTDALGIAKFSLIAGGMLKLDPVTLTVSVGDLLDRPVIAADPSDPGDDAVIVTQTRATLDIAPLTHVNIVVVSRVDYRASLKSDLEGSIRIVGAGMKIFQEGGGVRVALQVNDGSAALAILDPPPPVPGSKAWFTLVPNEVITTLYSGGDLTALQQVLQAIAHPPAADPDPVEAAVAADEMAVAILSLPASIEGATAPQTSVLEEETDFYDAFG